MKKITATIILTLCFLLAMAIGASYAKGGTWTTKASMPTARISFPTSVIDGIIYAIGGGRGWGDTTHQPISGPRRRICQPKDHFSIQQL